MPVSEPKLCLKCTNFPCTCGEQYDNLSDRGLLNLIHVLSQKIQNRFECKSVEVLIDNIPIQNVINNVTDDTTIFTSKDLVNVPDTWRHFKNDDHIRTLKAEDFLYLIVDKSTDDIAFPSGLILTTLLRCNIDNRQIALLLKKWLGEGQSDMLSHSLANEIDHKRNSFASILSHLTEEEYRLAAIEATDPSVANTTFYKVNKHTMFLLVNLLRNVYLKNREKTVCEHLFKLMYTLSTGEILSNNINWYDKGNNDTIFYCDESFRKIVAKELPSMVIPELSVFPKSLIK